MPAHSYDDDGKIDMTDIYNRPDPTRYFSTLARLDYQIPQRACPVFRAMIAARREARGAQPLQVLDLGCSYGINAALLKHGLTLAELFALYGQCPEPARARLIDRDRAIYDHPADPELSVVGLDTAERAVAYAVEAGILDAGITADFEARDPTAAEAALLAGTDLVISTGCFGYVTDATLRRLVEAGGARRPWMAHFVLRMFDFDAADRILAAHGYVTEKVGGLYPQRRFASDEERAHVLDNLARRGIDPTGAEAEGWYFAELHVARPAEDRNRLPLDRIAAMAPLPAP